MISTTTTVQNREGIHARPAYSIVEEASSFSSDLFLIKDDMRANAKSIMSVLTLAAVSGSTIVIEADGADEQQALDALLKLFNEKFHIDEA